MFISFKNKKISFNIIDSTFKSIFNKEEVEQLLKKYYKNKILFNSLSFRLENIQVNKNQVNLTVSKSDFYSLLTSNLLLNKVEELNIEYFKNSDILTNKSFSNNIAVSILIQDSNSNFLLTKRSNNLAVASSLISVSATGSFDYIEGISDFKQLVFSIVQKEVYEELNIKINIENLNIDGLFIGSKKVQPILICSVKLNEPFSITTKNFEVDYVKIVNRKELGKYLNSPITEASKFQILQEINCYLLLKLWDKTFKLSIFVNSISYILFSRSKLLIFTSTLVNLFYHNIQELLE